MNRYLFFPKPTRQWMRSPYTRSTSTIFSTAPNLASASAIPALRLSSRGLDMCLLAVCSCALSLMCHQTSGLLNLPSLTSGTATNPASGNAAQVDFVVKAGLVTSRQSADPDIQDES